MQLLNSLALARKSPHQLRVESFMLRGKQQVPVGFELPDPFILQLRATLILEEALEAIEALGFVPEYVSTNGKHHKPLHKDNVKLRMGSEPDWVEIVDGCCDLKVVSTGTMSALGLPDEPFQEEVDSNNMNKFGPGHGIRADGKVIKPKDHPKPDFAGVLSRLV